MGSTPQLASTPGRPVRSLGAIAYGLGVAHGWMAAMHFTHHEVTPAAFAYFLIAVVVPLLLAYLIAGRGARRDWNKVGLWFLLLSLLIFVGLAHGLPLLGAGAR